MKIECPNAACRHQFEVADTANPAALRCPICGGAIKAAPPPLPSAVSAPTKMKAPPVVPAPSVVTPSRLDLPPYLAVPTITDPNHAEIPPLERFQVLHSGEELVKSYQIRVRRPKFPWIAVLLAIVPMIFFFAMSIIAGRERSVNDVLDLRAHCSVDWRRIHCWVFSVPLAWPYVPLSDEPARHGPGANARGLLARTGGLSFQPG